jgi:hypothetical protein
MIEMLKEWDLADWFVAGSLTSIQVAATMFLFKFGASSPAAVFGVWCGLWATIIPLYLHLKIRDDKQKDAV